MERIVSKPLELDESKSREATYPEKVLSEMRSRFCKMGYVLHVKWESKQMPA